jgi:hypothetical protein
MGYPHTPQPGPRPGPPPGGFRPVPSAGDGHVAVGDGSQPYDQGSESGHPAVDAALRSLANAAALAPAQQIAAYEAAHQVLQETLASIDG